MPGRPPISGDSGRLSRSFREEFQSQERRRVVSVVPYHRSTTQIEPWQRTRFQRYRNISSQNAGARKHTTLSTHSGRSIAGSGGGVLESGSLKSQELRGVRFLALIMRKSPPLCQRITRYISLHFRGTNRFTTVIMGHSEGPASWLPITPDFSRVSPLSPFEYTSPARILTLNCKKSVAYAKAAFGIAFAKPSALKILWRKRECMPLPGGRQSPW